jgi:hypothetical protein
MPNPKFHLSKKIFHIDHFFQKYLQKIIKIMLTFKRIKKNAVTISKLFID